MFRQLLLGVAIFGLGWGASFGAGVAYGRRTAPPAAQAAPAPGGEGQPAQGQGQVGPAGQGTPGRALVFGTVDRVDGQTLYVVGPNNQQVKVALTDQTQILKQAPGSVDDLVAGTRVTVQPQGQPAADGALTAAALNVLPEGAAPGPANQPRQPGQQRQRQPGQPGGQERAPSG